MLRAIIASSETGSFFLQWVEYATLFVEALAVPLIVIAVVVALARYVIDLSLRRLQTMGEENVFLATPQVGEALNQAAAAAYAWLGQPPAGAEPRAAQATPEVS